MASRSARASGETLLVGLVLRPHGLSGEVKIEVVSDVPGRFAPGGELWLVSPGPAPRRERVRVEGLRPVRGGALLRLAGYGRREQAEAIRGGRLEVDVSEVPAAPPGFYYHHQLIRCRGVDERRGHLGVVVDVVEDGGGALLEVGAAGGAAAPGGGAAAGSLLVPFVESFLAAVDVDRRRIELRLPPGLIETCASKS